MNLVETAQLVGLVSVLILFSIKGYIVLNGKYWPNRSWTVGRIAMLWTVMYVFTLFLLRVLAFFNFGSTDELRIISGFTSVVPLVAVLIHLFLEHKIRV